MMLSGVHLVLLLVCCSAARDFGIVTGGIYAQGPQSFAGSVGNIICEFGQLGVRWIRIETDWSNTPTRVYQSIVQTAHSKVDIMIASNIKGIKVNILVTTHYCGDDSQPAQIDQFI